jgi:transcriptional regulator with XRE-family HTH domain
MGRPLPSTPRAATPQADRSAAANHHLDCYIGLRIQQARAARNVSLLQLSAACNITPDRLRLFESGDLRTEPAELWDMSQYLRQPISFFFSDHPAASGDM